MISEIQLDDLRRAAEKAGRGEMVLVDAELVLELLAERPKALGIGVEDAYKSGYEHGWEDCLSNAEVESYRSPRASDKAWDEYKRDSKL